MLAAFYHAQLCLILVHRVVDFVSSLTGTFQVPADQKYNDEGHWIFNFVPLVSMASVTWLLLVLQRQYNARAARRYRTDRNDLVDYFICWPTTSDWELRHTKCDGVEVVHKEDTCPICLERFFGEDRGGNRACCLSATHESCCSENLHTIWQSKQCGHIFHDECIIQWCQRQAAMLSSYRMHEETEGITCPCCRTPLEAAAHPPAVAETTPQAPSPTSSLSSPFVNLLQWFHRNVDSSQRRRGSLPLVAVFSYELAGVVLWLGMLSEIVRLVSGLCQERQ